MVVYPIDNKNSTKRIIFAQLCESFKILISYLIFLTKAIEWIDN